MIQGPFLWLALVVLFLIVEAITAGLTTIWFAGGAFVSAIASYLGAGIVLQILLFLIVSLLLVIFTRPLALKIMNKGITNTNVNSLIGRKAVVTRRVSNLEGTGQVKINDVDWSARTAEDDLVIPEKTVVVIDEVKGVKLIVHEYKEG